MQYLVQMEFVRSGRIPAPEENIRFMRDFILPSLQRCMELETEHKILAGGPISGAIAIAMIVEAESHAELSRLLMNLPFWIVMETRVTPLIHFQERQDDVQQRLENILNRQ